MSSKKKIAVLGLKGLPAFGGAASAGENIIEHLKSEYDFTVYLTCSHTKLASGKLDGISYIVFKKIPIQKLNVIYYNFVSAFHAVLFGKYDLIHLHHIELSVILPILRLKYKVIVTSHGSGFLVKDVSFKYSNFVLWLIRFSESAFIKCANIITCVSKSFQDTLKQKYKRQVFYIPNGVNSFSMPQEDNDNAIVFAAGRIIPTKGCHILLQALHEIDYKGKIRIIGDLEQVASYKKEILKLSAVLDVHFAGLIKEKKKLYQVIKNSGLFIFPSNVENMSMMMLEVASLQVPQIISDIDQNKLFDKDEVLYYKTDDVSALAEKISWAIKNSADMQSRAEKAKERVIKEYLWNNIAQQYNDLYKKLIFNKE